MTVEAATTFAGLDTTLPTATDLISEGDDHIRLLKTVLKTYLSGITSPLTASIDALNKVGVTQATSDNSTAPASTAFVQRLLAAASFLNTPLWVSGTTYAYGNTVFSPIDLQTYRCQVAGVSTTDPSQDPTNWAVLGGASDFVSAMAALTFLNQ